MKILVTGCTGLVGTRLLPRLIEAGFDCRALVRADKPLPSGVTVIDGDILDSSSLGPAVNGVDAVIHLAAALRSNDPEQIRAVNIEGTRNLIAATRDHGDLCADSLMALISS